jgi:hypothetical protein
VTGSKWRRVRRCATGWGILAIALGVAQIAEALIAIEGPQAIHFEWAPASGAPNGYLVFLSTNSGPLNSYTWVTGTSVNILARPGETLAIAVAAGNRNASGALTLGPQSPISERVRVDAAIGFSGDGEWMLHCASCGELALHAWSDSRLLEDVAAPRTPWRLLDRVSLRSGNDYLIWHNPNTGELAAWYSNLLRPVSGSAIGPRAARSVGSADFDGDGSSELLIEDTNTGEISLWGLSSWRGLERVAVITGPARTRLVAARDFDDNGKIELLWQNDLGLVEIWSVLRDPKLGRLVYSASERERPVPLGSEIVDSGDYDGDGHLDLLSRSRNDGRLAITFLTDGVPDETIHMPARGDDPLQRVVGSIDLNGGPGEEIVLQNQRTGAVSVQVSSSVRFVALEADPGWSLAPVGS